MNILRNLPIHVATEEPLPQVAGSSVSHDRMDDHLGNNIYLIAPLDGTSSSPRDKNNNRNNQNSSNIILGVESFSSDTTVASMEAENTTDPLNEITINSTTYMENHNNEKAAPSSTFIILATFLPFRMWIVLLSEGDDSDQKDGSAGDDFSTAAQNNNDDDYNDSSTFSDDLFLLVMCVAGTIWVVRMCRMRLVAEERTMERQQIVTE